MLVGPDNLALQVKDLVFYRHYPVFLDFELALAVGDFCLLLRN